MAHRFVNEPIADKPCTALPGILITLSRRLQDREYTLLGQYLLLDKDADLFKEWMKDTINANSKQASDCYRCLNNYAERFISPPT